MSTRGPTLNSKESFLLLGRRGGCDQKTANCTTAFKTKLEKRVYRLKMSIYCIGEPCFFVFKLS
jgi:hypothetical protein